MDFEKKSVLVLYNQIEEDEYVALRSIDPESLDFKPSYNIHVATVQEEYDAIVNALCAENFLASGVNLEDSPSRLHQVITQNPPDVVFNLVEFFHDDLNQESAVAHFFDLFRMPYTGASAFCLSLCRRKGLTKHVLLKHRVATPRFRVVNGHKVERSHGLRYPLIVKPSRQDGSTGVEACSVVYDHSQLLSQLERVCARFKPPFLLEEFIAGKELHVSVLGNNPPVVLPIVEFDFSELSEDHPPVITYEVKWKPLSVAYHRVHSRCPAELDRNTEKHVMKQVLKAYTATSCRDYARIDLRLGPDGIPYILEVNPNPDLTEGVSFMESAEEAGLSFPETLRRIVSFALERLPSS